MNFVHSTQT